MCNLTQLGTTRDKLYATILPYLRDNLLTAGISTLIVTLKICTIITSRQRLQRPLENEKTPPAGILNLKNTSWIIWFINVPKIPLQKY